MEKKSAAVLALIAAISASVGGAAFLHKNPKPTLRLVFVACEKGELSGIACCEDLNAVKDLNKSLEQCGQVSPSNHDPFGFRKVEEDAWDGQNISGSHD